MCASKGLQPVRIELDSHVSTVFCLNTLQAVGSCGQTFSLKLCASIFALWFHSAVSFTVLLCTRGSHDAHMRGELQANERVFRAAGAGLPGSLLRLPAGQQSPT